MELVRVVARILTNAPLTMEVAIIEQLAPTHPVRASVLVTMVTSAAASATVPDAPTSMNVKIETVFVTAKPFVPTLPDLAPANVNRVSPATASGSTAARKLTSV